MEERAEPPAGRLSVLRDLSRALGATTDPHRAASAVAEFLGPHLGPHLGSHPGSHPEQGVDGITAQLWLREGSGLRLAADEPPRRVGDHDRSDAVLIHPSTLPGLAATERRGVTAGDLDEEHRGRVSRSCAAAPFGYGSEVEGVLCVTADRPDAFDDDDVVFVEVAAIVVGNAIESGSLFLDVMELERLKADFIARISHELRTPITIISGFLDTLIVHDAAIEPGDRVHMLRRSREATDRLSALIGDLLMLSKVETGVLRPDVQTLDLADFLGAIADGQGGSVVVDVPAGAVLHGDPELLDRVVAPVVDNAVKYGHRAEVRARPHGDGWLLVIEDEGPGISDDVEHAMFEVFTRSAETTDFPGLGLGLAIARTVIEAIGGSIEIRPREPGPGTRVDLTVPHWR